MPEISGSHPTACSDIIMNDDVKISVTSCAISIMLENSYIRVKDRKRASLNLSPEVSEDSFKLFLTLRDMYKMVNPINDLVINVLAIMIIPPVYPLLLLGLRARAYRQHQLLNS